MGLFMWLNFSWYNHMYIYWPVVLIGLTVIIIFLPARVLYHRSRKWFAFSNVSYDFLSSRYIIPDLISGAYCSLESTPLSFVTSFLAICTVLRPTPWVTLSFFSVYTPHTGATLPNATPPTPACWDSSSASPPFGELSNVSADTWIRRTPFPIF
jgi:hypothetical protein